MYLAPDGDEIEIANAVAGLLDSAMPIGRLHAPDSADLAPPLRLQLGEMGWFALAVPEADGGSGLSAVEHTLFFREVGRKCGPVDLLAQCLAANAIHDPHLRLAVMSGQRGVALLVSDGEFYRLFGHAEADLAILVQESGSQLFSIAQTRPTPRSALDPANSMRFLPELPTPLEALTSPHIWQLGQLGVAAMCVGIAEASLELITEYAKMRETFGRKIGSWQAVRHVCADMAVRCEAARSQLWYAATATKEKRGDASAHLAAAKHLANQVSLANADSNIQLHGGIGVTDEHAAHLLLKHALQLSRLFGTKRTLLRDLLMAKLED